MAKDIGQAVREVCLGFPESAEVISHGSPDFRVRGKTFATYAVNHHGDGRIALWLKLSLSFWVGVDRQAMLTGDERYEIPPYMGHNGWIALDVTKHLDKDEARELALSSYRHFALKRMLQQLEPETES